MIVNELRERHPRIVYENFSVARRDRSLELTFSFLLEPDIQFRSQLVFESVNQSKLESIDPRLLDALFFNIGMVEVLSYWKAACSAEILVSAGSLTQEQLEWWEDLLLHGMREYFFVNQIDYKRKGFIKITTAQKSAPGTGHDFAATGSGTLVLTSGGKDTALSLQILKEAKQSLSCLLLNPTQAALDLASEAGAENQLIVRRTIDPKLLDLNKAGYLNGHTPFSAYLAFLGVTCAFLFGYDRIIVSNERSSDEGNVTFLGSDVNHQYSKTLRFEKKFQEYVERHFSTKVHYFSLLRPLYDLQITRVLAEYPQCLVLFKSCNRSMKDNSWCGHCPKCLSVYTMLYPFIEQQENTRIFGRDLFEKEENVLIMKELSGFSGHKPFECVGTAEEILAALYLCILRRRTRDGDLPIVLQYGEDNILPLNPHALAAAERLLLAWTDRHTLTPEFEELVKKQLRKINLDVLQLASY